MIMSVICNLSWHGNFDHENSKKNALSLNPPYKLKLLYFLGRFLFVRITDWPDPANYLARPIKFWIVCTKKKKWFFRKNSWKKPISFSNWCSANGPFSQFWQMESSLNFYIILFCPFLYLGMTTKNPEVASYTLYQWLARKSHSTGHSVTKRIRFKFWV